jgi:cell division transport system ATP-binding protein
MSTLPIITFKGVSAIYRDRLVLDAVSFEINMGEFVYLVGNTGSGKSTILRMIYADTLPSEGFIQVNKANLGDISPKELPFLRRKMGIVFQDFQLLLDRNVYENIYFALRATGWRDSRKIKQRISDVLVRVGMSGRADVMPHQLSGGEQQRVAIARALINDPIMLIADEPTGNLDPEASLQVMDILQKINLSGTAVLMATHEYPLIERFPSRVLHVINQGLIEYERPDAFLEKYWRM